MSEPEARHRLVAILPLDTAGYSRMMAEDDRVALATLDTDQLLHRGVSAITSPLSRLTYSCRPRSLTSLHEAASFLICEQTRLSSARHGPELAKPGAFTKR